MVRVSLLLDKLGPAVPIIFLALLLPFILCDCFSDERLFFELGTCLSFDEVLLSYEIEWLFAIGRLPDDEPAFAIGPDGMR